MKEISVTKIFEISYAHFLDQYEGACCRMHGHNGIIELTFTCSLSEFKNNKQEEGILIDFSDIKNTAEKIVKDKMDHRCLNDISFFRDKRPTAENMCFYIAEVLLPTTQYPLLSCVRVWEDRNSYAELRI